MLDFVFVQQYSMFMIREHARNLNKALEDPLVQQGLQALATLLGIELGSLTVEPGTQHDGAPDLLLTLPLAEQQLLVCGEIVRHLRPSQLALLEHRFEQLTRLGPCAHGLVIADYVSASLARRLRDKGVWFLDTVGNAYLEVPGAVMIYATGNRPPTAAPRRGAYLSPAGAKVLFLLLKYGPEVSLTYRNMASASGISLGRVSQVMQELVQVGILSQRQRGHYRVSQPKRLLENWITAYSTKLKPKLALGQFAWPHGREFRRIMTFAEEQSRVPGLAVGGEYAAEVLSDHLRAATATLWIPKDQFPQLSQNLKLLRSDKGIVEAVEAFSPEVVFEHKGFPLPLVHPALVYADLLDLDDRRCGETALLLKEKYLSWIS